MPRIRTAAVLLVLLACAGAAAAQAPRSRRALDEPETEALVHAYERADQWAMRAIAMLSLGGDWHPAGAAIVAAAVHDKDRRLLPFAIETVLRTDDGAARAVATPALVDAFVGALPGKNELVRTRLLQALQKLLPDAGAAEPAAWRRWWSQNKTTWAPPAWQAPERQPGGGTVAKQLVERAFDLRDAGLQVAFVLDTTGSMQVAIDAARDAIDDVAALLAGITDKLELGLVHYRDLEDFGDGAQLLVPLTKDHAKVRDKLAHLVANGGGDAPERVEKGVEVALGREMGWNKDKNRMLLVVGDAPPHDEDVEGLLEMVKRAHDFPFSKGKGAVTGSGGRQRPVRPFITSAIATSAAAKPAFDRIAAAGGGTSVLLDLGAARKVDGKPIGGRRPSAAQKIAEHVLLLSFGAGYEQQLRAFVDVFFEYRNAGAL